MYILDYYRLNKTQQLAPNGSFPNDCHKHHGNWLQLNVVVMDTDML